jgi:hypothetical protein
VHPPATGVGQGPTGTGSLWWPLLVGALGLAALALGVAYRRPKGRSPD